MPARENLGLPCSWASTAREQLITTANRYTSRDRDEVKAGMADTLEGIRVAQRLGTDGLAVTPGYPCGTIGRTVAEMDRVVATILRRLAPVAQEHGV